VEGTDQAKEPVLSIESAMVRMGTAFVEGPWRRSSEILSEGSVGVQVISKDWPAGISSPRPGWPIGFPDGGLAVFAGVSAETEAARARAEAKIVESMVLDIWWLGREGM